MDSTLRQLLVALGEPLVDVAVAPAGLDVPLTGLAIVDPEDEPDHHAGQLILLIGARGQEAARLVGALAHRGAAAVAVKAGREVGFKVPVVVRLEGTNVDKAREILKGVRTELPMIQSASAITSRSCSITTTLWPPSTRRCSTRISFSTSAMCRPTVGSSST